MTDRRMKVFLTLLVAGCAALSISPTAAGQGLGKVTDRFPPGSIRSVAQADTALSEAAAEQVEIEARFATEEQACYPNFFTTSCIQQAKDRRRISLSALRQVEIEANAFKRKARLAERDQALADRLEKDARQRQERENRVMATDSAATSDTRDESSQKVHTALFPTSEKQQAAPLKRKKSEDPISAEERAANIAAYEQKKRDALERQQKVAKRKSEKEQKRKEKQAETGNPS